MRLSDVDYARCFVGMPLISFIETPGIIAEMLATVRDMDGDDRPGFRIHWKNGNVSIIAHNDSEHISVPSLDF